MRRLAEEASGPRHQLEHGGEIGTDEESYAELSGSRPGCSASALKHLGFFRFNEEWWAPGYSYDNAGELKIHNLYVWRHAGNSASLLSTPGKQQCVIGLNHYNPNLDDVWIVEGQWDWVAAYSMLHRLKSNGVSLSESVAILGTPGTAIPEILFSFLKGKRVRMLYDADSAGAALIKQTTEKVAEKSISIQSLTALDWPKGTPDGFDLRDLCNLPGKDVKSLPPDYAGIDDLGKVYKWVISHQQKKIAIPKNAGDLVPEACTSWEDLCDVYRQALHTDDAWFMHLSIIFAVLIGPRIPGPMLWIWLLGSAGSGKTTMVECAASGAPFANLISRFTGLYSGIGNGADNKSLVNEIDGRTLVVKDFTVMFSGPRAALDENLGALRDLYDGSSHVVYRTGVRAQFENVNFNIIGCSTPVARQFVTSDKGERFLTVDLNTEFTSEGVKFTATDTSCLTRSTVSNLRSRIEEGFTAKSLILPKRVSWGFLEYLASKCEDPNYVAKISSSLSKEYEEWVSALAEWTAAARAVVPHEHLNSAIRPQIEAGSRLASQFWKASIGLCVVRGWDNPTAEHEAELKKHILKIGFDTGYSFFLDAMLHLSSDIHIDRATLADYMALSTTRIQSITTDMAALGIIKTHRASSEGRMGQPRTMMQLAEPYASYAKLLGFWKKQDEPVRRPSRIASRHSADTDTDVDVSTPAAPEPVVPAYLLGTAPAPAASSNTAGTGNPPAKRSKIGTMARR